MRKSKVNLPQQSERALLGRPAHLHITLIQNSTLQNICMTCAKASDIVIKIMTSTWAGVEMRIHFLICYFQSLYEIELGHYFCSEFVGQVTNQKILVDAGKLV